MRLEVFDILLPSGVDVFMTNFIDTVARDNENGRKICSYKCLMSIQVMSGDH